MTAATTNDASSDVASDAGVGTSSASDDEERAPSPDGGLDAPHTGSGLSAEPMDCQLAGYKESRVDRDLYFLALTCNGRRRHPAPSFAPSPPTRVWQSS